MINEVREHVGHYTVLGAWLGVGLFLFVFLSYSIALQFLVLIVFAAGYVMWGVLHHHINHDLQGEIVLEYLLIAALTVVLVGGISMQ